MKKVVVLLVFVVAAMPALADISGSDHDFSGDSWNTEGELCNVCHVPHSPDNQADGPLWNHTTTSQTFVTYGTTVYGTDVSGQPQRESKLCMSCHDGQTNMDAYGGAAGSTTMGAVPGNLGLDLSTSHPVGFTYDDTVPDIVDMTTNVPALGGTIQNVLLGANDNIACSSCHDPHDDTNAPFLRIAQGSTSALCVICHEK